MAEKSHPTNSPFIRYYFTTDKPISVLRQMLRVYFRDAYHSDNNSDGFSGFFTSENEFEIRSVYQMTSGSRPFKGIPSAKGKFIPVTETSTELQLDLKKNSPQRYLLFLAAVTVCVMTYGLYSSPSIGILPVSWGFALLWHVISYLTLPVYTIYLYFANPYAELLIPAMSIPVFTANSIYMNADTKRNNILSTLRKELDLKSIQREL